MYAVITCAHCKQAVQVAQESLGKLVRCPLCGQPTSAEVKTTLPIAEPLPEAAPTDAQPLSLDEAEQLPQRGARSAERGTRNEPSATPRSALRAPRSPMRLGLQIGGSLALAVLAVAAVYAYFRYGAGAIPDRAWREFRPPEGRCVVLMPGEPEAFDIPPDAYASIGGKRFTKQRWFEKVAFSIAWIDFDSERFCNNTTFEQAVMAERDREMKRLNGTVARDVRANLSVSTQRRFDGQEIDIDYDGGKQTLRYLMERDVTRQRLYILSVSGPKVVPGRPPASKFIDSFQPSE